MSDFFAANWASPDWAPANWAPADWPLVNWAPADWALENFCCGKLGPKFFWQKIRPLQMGPRKKKLAANGAPENILVDEEENILYFGENHMKKATRE